MKESIWALEYTWNRVNSYTPIMILLILALVYLYSYGEKKVIRYLVYPNILFVLFILNPKFEWIMVNRLGLMSRIHRFFWIIPVTFILSYVILEIFERKGKKSYFLFYFILFLWIVMGRNVYEEPHYKTENIYKIRDDVLEISDIMKDIASTKYFKVFFNDIYINYMIRQYDPSFVLLENPNILESILQSDDLNELCMQDNIEDAYLLTGYFCGHYDVNFNRLLKAIKDTEVDYLILNYEEKILTEKGIINLMDKTKNYYIYKVV